MEPQLIKQARGLLGLLAPTPRPPAALRPPKPRPVRRELSSGSAWALHDPIYYAIIEREREIYIYIYSCM